MKKGKGEEVEKKWRMIEEREEKGQKTNGHHEEEENGRGRKTASLTITIE